MDAPRVEAPTRINAYACDTETTLSRPWEYVPRLVVASFDDGKNKGIAHRLDRKDIRKIAVRSIENHSAIANAPFDLSVFCKEWPDLTVPVFDAIEAGIVHDPLSRAKLWDIAHGRYKFNRGKGKGKGHGLAACCLRELKVEVEKEDTFRLRYGEFMETPLSNMPKEAIDYSIKDSEMHRRLFEHQEDQRQRFWVENEGDVFGDEFRQVRAKWSLYLAQAWGMVVDQDAVKVFKANVNVRWQQRATLLQRQGLVRADGSKNTKVAKARMMEACEKIGLKLSYTDKGMELLGEGKTPEELGDEYLSLDEESCLNSGDDILIAYAEYTSLQKLLGTYIRVLEETGCYPIHTNFEEMVDTCRTSSWGPNIQNLPRKFEIDDPERPGKKKIVPGARECYIPRPGCCFLIADFSKAELVALAEILLQLQHGHSTLAEALNNNIDPHSRIAAQILDRSYEEIEKSKSKSLKDGTDNPLFDPEVDQTRNCGKAANFGFWGGMGGPSYVGYAKANYGVDVSLDKALALRADWRLTWDPDANAYLRWISSLMGGHSRTSIKAFGAEIYRGGITFTQAANGFFQMLTATAAKHALWCVTKKQFCDKHSALYGTHTVNFPHDELIVECPIDRAKTAMAELELTMVTAYNEFTPHVPVQVEGHIEDRWRK